MKRKTKIIIGIIVALSLSATLFVGYKAYTAYKLYTKLVNVVIAHDVFLSNMIATTTAAGPNGEKTEVVVSGFDLMVDKSNIRLNQAYQQILNAQAAVK